MKRILFLLCALGAAAAFATPADHWTFNGTAITDGDWTFAATVSGTDLTVGACSVWPTTVSELDFAKPVKDAAETTYAIVTLNTQFAYSTDVYGKCSITSVADNARGAQYVGAVKFPETGLTTISQCALGHCTALTNVVPFLPDSVTSLGPAAFFKAPVAQDLFLRGIGTMQTDTAFNATQVKSVTFGPNLKALNSRGNKYQMFNGVTTLTNIVFDPACSGVTIAGRVFQCSSTLNQPLVLHGVTSVETYTFANMKFSSVTFAKGITTIGDEYTFSGNTSLKEIHFLGDPPASLDLTYSGATTKITTYIRRRYAAAWTPYAEGGILNMQDSTFSTASCSTYSTTPANRPLLIEDKVIATTVMVR